MLSGTETMAQKFARGPMRATGSGKRIAGQRPASVCRFVASA
jgi:hypothetical protein